MKLLRMLGVLMCAVFAFALVGASAASASEPEFKPSTKNTFKFASSTSVLAATGNVVTCAADSGTGEITGTDTVANVHVSFTKCRVTASGTCAVKSSIPAGGTEEILTVTLKGNLGTVKTAEAASGVGLLLEPVSAEFTTLEKTTCSIETKVTGKIIGEVNPIHKLQNTGTLTFALNAGTKKQAIAEINVLNQGFKEVPPLKAFGSAASELSTENITFASNVEVT